MQSLACCMPTWGSGIGLRRTWNMRLRIFGAVSEMNADLATALSGLGRVHIAMGKVRECEKEEVEALKLRERLGDRLLVARSKDDLAELYLAEQKYAKARDAAQEAIDAFAAEERADSFDKISARYTLALTMCASKDCPSAVAPLKEAIEEAKTSFQTRDFPFGLGEFLLGYAYWKSGDLPDAAVNMKQGTEIINAQLGWTHPISLAAMRHYAHFLRASQRTDRGGRGGASDSAGGGGGGCSLAARAGRFWYCRIALVCWR